MDKFAIMFYMQRKISFSEGEYYHVYNRGVDKREIFMDRSDWIRFQRMLYVANSTKPMVYKTIQGVPLDKIDRGEPLVAIGAYCLMPNHFHLLLKEISEGGVTSFMEKLGTGYSMYFNKRSKRSGFLFQGNFKAEHVDRDEYLKYLYAYIHLNPVKLINPDWKEKGIANLGKAKKYLNEYSYSSYLDHGGKEREEAIILTPKEFPSYFEGVREFNDFIKDWLEYKDEAALPTSK